MTQQPSRVSLLSTEITVHLHFPRDLDTCSTSHNHRDIEVGKSADDAENWTPEAACELRRLLLCEG